MNIAQLIFNLPAATKYVVRNVEKCKNKLINCQYAAQFNKTCLNENILPNYTNIKVHDPAARSDNITLEYRRKLVERQFQEKVNLLPNLEQAYETAVVKLQETNINQNL